MVLKRITRKILKISAFICGGFLVLLTAFHFWFINHAEDLIEEMVASKSNGKLRLEVKKFRFNWFSYKMELRQAVFYSTDTATASTGYRFRVKKIDVGVKAILPLIFEKTIVIDSLTLVDPAIEVTKLRSRDTTNIQDTSLSIPQEMGRIYNSIQDALQVLKVDRFQIENGKFTLINKVSPAEVPVTITNLYFHLDNLQVDSSDARGKEKILFSDNVSLRTHDQDILFPDGRHRLSFGNFRINILKKLVEFDSCTITATRGDSANNSFRVFFDKLMLTNINFDTLYHSEFIKADSVYCINPQFKLDITLAKKDSASKSPPKLDELIRQLTGDMHLNFVVVQNGSFDINTIRDGKPSSFISSNNNFDLQGLRIQQSAARALTVERFAMAIRNYENFLRDSSYAVSFDSILLNNSRISLSNFSFRELKNGKTINSLSMPQFELQGLSWDELVFDQYLKADNVTLFQPVINYSVVRNKKNKQQDVFQVLSGIGNIMKLSNLYVVNGELNLHFGSNSLLRLQNMNMSVRGSDLVGSKKIAGIQHAVPDLNFRKGSYRTGNLTADLSDVRFSGTTGQLNAASIRLNDPATIVAEARGITINNMLVDDAGGTILKGVSWNSANFSLLTFPGGESKSNSRFSLNDINGSNTQVAIAGKGKKISLYLTDVTAREISKSPNTKMLINGLVLNGKTFAYTDSFSIIRIAELKLADLQRSSLKNLSYSNHSITDSISVIVPSASLVPDLNAIMNGTIKTGVTSIAHPVVSISLLNKEKEEEAPVRLPNLVMDKLTIEEPVIHFTKEKEEHTITLDWDAEKGNNSLVLENIRIAGKDSGIITAGKLNVALQNFIFITEKGKKFHAGEGKLNVQLSKLKVKKNEIDGWDWRGTVDDMDAFKFQLDSLGKNNGRLMIGSARLQNLSVSSSSLLNIKELVKQNTSFSLQNLTGSYQNINNRFNWYNAAYRKQSRIFSIDSFSYQPTLARDSFVAAHPYQADHVVIHTGAITAGPFDVDRYLQDTIVDAGIVTINNVHLSNYRDQRPPRLPGLVKLLPANTLKHLPVKLTLDTVILDNALIEYEEMNEKTNKAGKVSIENLNANITDIRNFDLTDTDSLHFKATARIAGAIATQLDMKESYTDSLGGFLLTAKMGPADLTILNPILIPLLSAELRSGQLDTLTMRVIGREFLAFGEMKMFYHDLKVKILKNGDRDKKSFFGGILNFFANTLIKNKNTSRTGNVFFQRLRDRSAANYLFKITLSGITSSVGVKSNKKMIRKYKREIRKRNLPPISS